MRPMPAPQSATLWSLGGGGVAVLVLLLGLGWELLESALELGPAIAGGDDGVCDGRSRCGEGWEMRSNLRRKTRELVMSMRETCG